MRPEAIYFNRDQYTRARANERNLLIEFALMSRYRSPARTLFDVGSRLFQLVRTERENERSSEPKQIDALKIRTWRSPGVEPSAQTWASYWRRRDGMKVYGDYELFLKDVTLIKMFGHDGVRFEQAGEPGVFR